MDELMCTSPIAYFPDLHRYTPGSVPALSRKSAQPSNVEEV